MPYSIKFKRIILYALISFIAGTNVKSQAQAHVGEIQSGIIYYFTKYMVWGGAKSFGDFTIYLVGEDNIGSHLKAMVNEKRLAGVQTMKYRQVKSISEVTDAHIVFLSKSEIDEFETALEFAKTQSFLLVTAVDGYGKKGSGCNFVVRNGKQAYELNLESLDACNLKAGTKIKSLAVIAE